MIFFAVSKTIAVYAQKYNFVLILDYGALVITSAIVL